MRVLIIADMEGVIGIESRDQCSPRMPEYQRGRQLLADEVNLVAAAAREAGATSTSVIDWHAGGGNLSHDLLDQGVDIVAEDFSPGYDVVLLTGFHAMAGTGNAFISHTMSQPVTLEMNGVQTGELAILSRWAGESGVPVALLSGDEATLTEGREFLPGTPGVAVKKAISWEHADCLPAEQANTLLRNGVIEALSNPSDWKLYRNDTPVSVRLKLDPEPPMVGKIPWLKRDAEGWLTGEVDSTKGVIDLIDLVSALR